MNKRITILILLFPLFPSLIFSQSLFDSAAKVRLSESYKIRGFARAGFFVNELSGKPSISTGFSDFALKLTAEDGSSYKAYADLRFRYGLEFGNTATEFSINEAYISWYNRWIEISAGQQIIKWSKSDFFRDHDRMNPRNYLYRTFDDGDRDLGNMMLRMNIYPAGNFQMELLYLPFEKPSTLTTEVMDLPEFLKISSIQDLRLDRNNGSWAINMGFSLKNIDIGFNFYLGSNPMPMICFDTLILRQQPEDPPSELNMDAELYRVSRLSSNIGLVLGKTILRGEFSFLKTYKTGYCKDYIPFSEFIWLVGIEPSLGNFRFLMEYQGKKVLDFIESAADPVFPQTIEMPAGMPPVLMDEAIGQQVTAFNRLYNYQLNEYNHSFGLRLSYDNNISIIKPELNIIYNATTDELMINPLIRIKPADNLTIFIGSDIFNGKTDSLYDLLDSKLSSVYLGLRVNF